MTAPTLTVGRLAAYIDVEGEWKRDLSRFDDELKRAAAAAQRHLDGIGTSFKRTGSASVAASDTVGASSQRMADKVAAAGKRLTAAREAEARALQAVISASNALDFERIGGDADKLTAAQKRLDTALRQVERSQRDVASSAKALGSAQAELGKAGDWAGRALGEGVTTGLRTKMAVLGPVAAGVAVPALGYAGTLAGSAFVLGAGGAIAGLGLKMAAESNAVKDRWTDLMAYLSERSGQIAKPFESTLFQISDQVKHTFDEFAPTLEDANIKLAPVISRFTGNISRALLELEPAVDPLTDAFAALMDELGPRLPQITDRLADSMTRLSDAIEENPEVLADLVEGLGTAASAVLDLIGVLTRAYGAVDSFYGRLSDNEGWIRNFSVSPASDAIKALVNEMGGAEEPTNDLTHASEELRRAQDAAAAAAAAHAEALNELVRQADDVIGSQLDLRDAVMDAQGSVEDYTAAVRTHGRGSREAAEAQLQAERAAHRLKQATEEAALAQQAASGSARNVAAAAAAARAQLQTMADTTSGPLRTALLGQIGILDATLARLNALARTYYANVQVTVTQTGRYTGPAMGAMPHFARGGSIGPGEIGEVGETEPEILRSGGKSYLLMGPQPGYITPGSQLALGGGAGASGGGEPVEVRLRFEGSGLSGLDRAMWEWLQSRIHVVGGGNVQLALGGR